MFTGFIKTGFVPVNPWRIKTLRIWLIYPLKQGAGSLPIRPLPMFHADPQVMDLRKCLKKRCRKRQIAGSLYI
jgi:hypothetical protein